ncbi:MAG TPA: NUDIX hydrolase [Nitrososphaera sp.]|nr:NUDIX hydrolase [Nitrososphaera sp.]
MNYRNPTPTIDAILQKGSRILMVRRKKDPFKGMLALPGGFVNEGETVEDAVKREVLEETSLEIEPINILGVYSDPHRDPRMHTMTVVFVSIITGGKEKAEDDASNLEWVELADVKKAAFDHALIIADYRQWRGDSAATTYWSTKRRHD